jgi:SecD-like export protein
MDDRDLEARLRARLHQRFDDAQPPHDLVAGIEQVFATEPRRIGLALPHARSGVRLTWSLVTAAVLIAVVALAAIAFRPLIGPGAPTQTPSTVPSAIGPDEQIFIVLPPTSVLPSKAESDLASAVMTARLRALGIGTFTGAGGNALQFRIQESGHSEDAIRTVLAAIGDVSIVPLPAADYGQGKLTAEVGAPLPKVEPALFGWEGIASVELDTTRSSPAVTVILKEPAAAAFETYTTAHVGETFAIVLDGTVAMLPTVMAPIPAGELTLSAGLDADDSFATTTAILAGGVLPESWRGASAPILITPADAADRVMRAEPIDVIEPRETSLDAIVVDGEWRAVWNVLLTVMFPSSSDSNLAIVTGKLVVVDAVTGDFLSSVLDPETSSSP